MTRTRRLASIATLALAAAGCWAFRDVAISHGPALDEWSSGVAAEARAALEAGREAEARRLLERIAAVNPGAAHYQRARLIRDGVLNGGGASTLKSTEASFAAAAAGTGEIAAKALLNLARLREDLGAPEADVLAMLGRASDLGSRRASTLLGLRLLASPAAAEQERAMRILWKASWSDPHAALALARLYANGARAVPSLRTVDDLRARSISMLRAEAAEGDVDAMFTMGRLRTEDNLGHNDPAEALAWFRAAAAKGAIKGMLGAAKLALDESLNVDQPGLAVQLLQEAAAAGSAEAAYRLSEVFKAGKAAPQDLRTADMWLHKAADAGWVAALIDLAAALTGPSASAEEFDRGLSMYQRAWALDSASAAARLAQALERAGRAEVFGASAFEWYERAAAKGDASAMARLAKAHRAGDLDLANADPALEAVWTRRALENGYKNVGMMLWLAEAYIQGRHGLPPDLGRAARWLEAAATLGSVSGMVGIAKAYKVGRGVSASAATAMEWFALAAAKGSIQATEELARAHASGLGVPYDSRKAYRLFRWAAAAGSAVSQRESGRALELGFGTAPDLANAARFYRQAAEAGDADAMVDLAMLSAAGYDNLVAPQEAGRWLDRAARMGDAEAKALLARSAGKAGGQARRHKPEVLDQPGEANHAPR